MLRAVRFSTQLGFKIEPKSFAAICSSAKNITGISGERIAVELEGIFVSPNRSWGARLLFKSGLAASIFPGFGKAEAKLAASVLAGLPETIDFALGLAAFFAGCETASALNSCKILRLSRTAAKHIKFLLANRGRLLNDKMSLAELRLIVSEPYFQDLYDFQKAIQKASRRSIGPLILLKKRIKALGDIELKPAPLLNGHDLIRLGAVPGPALGQLAREMYIAQLEGKIETSQQGRKWVRNWLDRHRES